jgi:uncharacterized protein YecE (DUF72 family)
MGEIRIGCSGFSYDDWVGPFYPSGTEKRDFLEYYAGRFDTVEINVTYYRIPHPGMVKGWVDRTPEGFLFAVKANKQMTHEADGPKEAVAAVPEYLDGLAPMFDAGRLGCVLLQFPWSFRPTHQARDILEALIEALEPLPLVCEFRHAEWVRGTVKRWLSNRDVGYCCVDQPDIDSLMPREAVVTASTGYIRFHGRNKEKWFQHDEAWERYDYRYSEEELAEWVPRARELAEECERLLVYFNNHRSGQAPENAEVFRELLADVG